MQSLHIDQSNSSYQLIMGGLLHQLMDLLRYLGINNRKGNMLVSCMVDRQSIQ